MAKTLTVKNPWAYLIAIGAKDIENRSWKTNFRGTILIHTSAKMDYPLFTAKQFEESLHEDVQNKITGKDLPMSSIIGQVDIVDCVQDHPSIWAEEGMYHWVLENAILYPIPISNVKGKLSIWNYEHNPSNTPKGYLTKILKTVQVNLI